MKAPHDHSGAAGGVHPGRCRRIHQKQNPAAWHAPQAWDGLTKVGGGTMPAAIAGQAGLNELVIHGWDLARGTGQPYKVDEASAQASAGFLSLASAAPGQRGPFGPVVEVPDDAPVLDRAVGLSGRDPNWPAESS